MARLMDVVKTRRARRGHIVGLVIALMGTPPVAEAERQRGPSSLDELIMLESGDGHFFFVEKMPRDLLWEANTAVYFGSRSSLGRYPARRFYDKRKGTGELRFWDPFSKRAAIEYESDGWRLRCGDELKTLKIASKAARAKIVASAKLSQFPKWTREAKLLARDSDVNYYYLEQDTRKDALYRLYVGRRAALKELRVVRIAADPQGLIVVTREGTLKVARTPGMFRPKSVTWTTGDKSLALTVSYHHHPEHLAYPTDPQLRFIFTELGVYLGTRVSTPCTDVTR